MRKIVLISVAAALLVPALPASAAPAANAAQQQAPSSQPARSREEAAPNPERQVCVSEQLSNSRMPRRVCRTAREWQLLHGSDSE